MTDTKRAADRVAREAILNLLSGDELAKVSNAEDAARLNEGEEYIDLENLVQGVQRAGALPKVTMGTVLPRGAVRDETWTRILNQLADGRRTPNTSKIQSPQRMQEIGGGGLRRLLHDRGFLIHFSVYLAVNALLIVINLATEPGKYWFYWPLLGWGLGIAGHAFAVLQRTEKNAL